MYSEGGPVRNSEQLPTNFSKLGGASLSTVGSLPSFSLGVSFSLPVTPTSSLPLLFLPLALERFLPPFAVSLAIASSTLSVLTETAEGSLASGSSFSCSCSISSSSSIAFNFSSTALSSNNDNPKIFHFDCVFRSCSSISDLLAAISCVSIFTPFSSRSFCPTSSASSSLHLRVSSSRSINFLPASTVLSFCIKSKIGETFLPPLRLGLI
mmetsp:Transcript_6486/g.14671  ORF Transcript_6486/g.14671 Transcript_6486/m.14671 type:complete len:210 (-) Transcript_6486:1911-2540(-)